MIVSRELQNDSKVLAYLQKQWVDEIKKALSF